VVINSQIIAIDFCWSTDWPVLVFCLFLLASCKICVCSQLVGYVSISVVFDKVLVVLNIHIIAIVLSTDWAVLGCVVYLGEL